MFIRSQTTTLLQIFCELLLCSQVIFKSMKVADVRFWWSSKCEWVKLSVNESLHVQIISCLQVFKAAWFEIAQLESSDAL